MAREFTRAEFHDLVWSNPITHLAKEFSLSDVAIHKICRKHSVPTPPPGWWARKRAGQTVKRTPLPKAGDDVSDRIVIAAPELRGETNAAARVRQTARVRATALPADADIKPDPFVERTVAALRKAEPSLKGLVEVSGEGLFRCEIAPASIDRLKLVLNRIAAAAALQGFVLVDGWRGAAFSGDGETLTISIIEAFRRVKHVLTPAEQKMLDAWDRRQGRASRRSSWDDPDFAEWPRFAEWDYVCTGQIGFELESVHMPGRQGPRSTFRDGKVQRLEAMAEDISVALAVLTAAKREQRERREEEERVRLEAKRIRELPLRAKFVADRRREALEAVLADLADLDRLRRLLTSLETITEEGIPVRVEAFLANAREELAARENALSVQGLERRFEGARLFGTDDDHSFKSPYYY